MSGLDGHVKLLLHCDGIDASTTFTDSSDQAHTVTAVNDAQVDTAQSVFGGASALFDGTGDYLTASDSDDWNIWNGDSTIDLRVRFNAYDGIATQTLVSQRFSSTVLWFFTHDPDSGLRLGVINSTSDGTFSGAFTPTSDTWYHIAVERHGNDTNFYVDGTQLTTITSVSWDSPINYAAPLFIGGNNAGTSSLNGWIDELRISKGIARYKGSSFTLPATAYSLTTPDNWYKDLATPPPPRVSLGAPSQSFFFYVADLASIAFSALLNGFRGWFVPLAEPVRIPPRLETGSQQFSIPPNQPIFRRSRPVDGSHDGNPQLHGVHDLTSQIATKVNS